MKTNGAFIFMIRTIRFWLHNARYIALPQSLLPALLAICMAMQTDSFSWQLAIIAFIGVAFVHLAANLTDDYFDYRKTKYSYPNKIFRPYLLFEKESVTT